MCDDIDICVNGRVKSFSNGHIHVLGCTGKDSINEGLWDSP